MGEVYKQIQDFDYECSNYGNIRNMKTGRILKHHTCKNLKYVQLTLDKGKSTKFYVHMILAIFYREGFEKCEYSYEGVMKLCEQNIKEGMTEKPKYTELELLEQEFESLIK